MTTKPQAAKAADTVKPGRYTSELSLVVGVPAIDGLIAYLVGAEAIPAHWRLAVYSLVAIYTLSRTWLKGKAVGR